MKISISSLPVELRTLPAFAVHPAMVAANEALEVGLGMPDAIAIGLAAARMAVEVDEAERRRADGQKCGRVQREDRVQVRLDASTVVHHANGWIDVWGVATRVGVFRYEGEDGGDFFELRPRDEVLDAASLASLRGVPFTIQHPAGEVDSTNARELTHGWVLEVEARVDQVWTRVRIATDEAKQAIADGLIELSCGYTARLDFTPGTTESGERYDAIQREIRYNHLALVDLARAGPVARLRFDGLRVQRDDKERHAMKHTLSYKGKDYKITTFVADGLRAAAAKVKAAKAKGGRLDFETGTISIEGTELVVPIGTVQEVLAMLGAAEGAGEEMPEEPPAEEPPMDGMGEGDDPNVPPEQRGDRLDRSTVQRMIADALGAERKRADARARERAEVERKAATVLDAGFRYSDHDTASIQLAVIKTVDGEALAKDAAKLAERARKGDARAQGRLDGDFEAAVRRHADARQAEVDELGARVQIGDGGEQPRIDKDDKIEAARRRRADRVSGRKRKRDRDRDDEAA